MAACTAALLAPRQSPREAVGSMPGKNRQRTEEVNGASNRHLMTNASGRESQECLDGALGKPGASTFDIWPACKVTCSSHGEPLQDCAVAFGLIFSLLRNITAAASKHLDAGYFLEL